MAISGLIKILAQSLPAVFESKARGLYQWVEANV